MSVHSSAPDKSNAVTPSRATVTVCTPCTEEVAHKPVEQRRQLVDLFRVDSCGASFILAHHRFDAEREAAEGRSYIHDTETDVVHESS